MPEICHKIWQHLPTTALHIWKNMRNMRLWISQLCCMIDTMEAFTDIQALSFIVYLQRISLQAGRIIELANSNRINHMLQFKQHVKIQLIMQLNNAFGDHLFITLYSRPSSNTFNYILCTEFSGHFDPITKRSYAIQPDKTS